LAVPAGDRADEGGSVKILIVTDAWFPQVNGVVRTIDTTKRELEKLGHTVEIISPETFRTIPLPTYPEIRIAIAPGRRIRKAIDAMNPHAIHLATEGPLGFAARRYCLKRKIPFTTAYHTRFPEYVRDRAPIPLALTYRIVRRFHAPSSAVMVATPSIERALTDRGFKNIRRWGRGVDTELFHPRNKSFLDGPRPILMYVGRVSVEKNIEAFLRLDLPGSKVVAGTGPALAQLKQRFPEAHFLGVLSQPELARLYSAASAFVFPSRTDTFGLVLLEALACGTPVAAYPVQGPVDVVGSNVVGHSRVGVLDDDLQRAALAALRIDRASCRAFALSHSWRACTEQFLSLQQPARTAPGTAGRNVELRPAP
jgi:glycosyltransferase involved in cell wall biosynthesis